MAKLKFGSPAWRKKYMKPKHKIATKKRNSPHSRGTRYKKKRMAEMLREVKPKKNPPKGWIKANAVRVVRRNGRTILEVKR